MLPDLDVEGVNPIYFHFYIFLSLEIFSDLRNGEFNSVSHKTRRQMKFRSLSFWFYSFPELLALFHGGTGEIFSELAIDVSVSWHAFVLY
jgi:hypothetical protein